VTTTGYVRKGAPHQRSTPPFTLRIGHEQPNATRGCYEKEGCPVDNIKSTDLYCHEHERLLAFSTEPTNRRRVVFTLAATAACGAFLLTGQSGNMLPVFAVAVMFGTAALALPLRSYPTAQTTAVVAWILGAITTLVLDQLVGAARRDMRLVLLVLLVVAATGYLIRRAVATVERVAAALVVAPASVGAALLACYAAIRANPLHLLPVVGTGTQDTMLFLAAANWLLALLCAVVTGLIDGLNVSVLPVAPLLQRRSPPTRRAAAHGIVEQIGTAAEYAILFLLYVLAQAGVLATNLLWFIGVVCVRRLVVTLQHAAAVLREAAVKCTHAAAATLRVVVLPVFAVAAAARLAVMFADRTRDYLFADSLVALAWVSAAVVIGNAALFVAWSLLVAGPGGQNLSLSLQSIAHTARITTPYWLLLQAVGGWLVALPGAFGYGRVHVGWATYASTGVLLVSFAIHLLVRRGAPAGPARSHVGDQPIYHGPPR
jgi:hypothetical protein